MQIFATTTRGLEAVCAQEMSELPGLALRDRAYRRVLADYSGPLAGLLALRTVDDVYLALDTWEGIVRQREALAQIKQASARLKLAQAAAALREARALPALPAFSVTASFVGKRNYSSDEIKKTVAEGVNSRTGWAYAENDQPGVLNLRVFIEGEQALVGLRLSDTPLHQRPYKQANIPGSTKPTVAAAMVRLAQVTPGARVLDPCCGAGTILIEVALQGAGVAGATGVSGATGVAGATEVAGGDIDPEAVAASRSNCLSAGVAADIRRWDARRLPLPDRAADRIISNLPWGRQVSVEMDLAAYYQAITQEMRRVLVPGGRIVLLANAPQQVSVPGMRLNQQIEISLFGQNPHLLIFE